MLLNLFLLGVGGEKNFVRPEMKFFHRAQSLKHRDEEIVVD